MSEQDRSDKFVGGDEDAKAFVKLNRKLQEEDKEGSKSLRQKYRKKSQENDSQEKSEE